MTKRERDNWIVNIESIVSTINHQLDSAVVDSVLARYGVRSVWELNSSELSEVFSELYAIEADLR